VWHNSWPKMSVLWSPQRYSKRWVCFR
jgi:hypothetical protein